MDTKQYDVKNIFLSLDHDLEISSLTVLLDEMLWKFIINMKSMFYFVIIFYVQGNQEKSQVGKKNYRRLDILQQLLM